MLCPACAKEYHTLLVCPACWNLIPKPDRVQLGNLVLRHHDKPQVYRSKYEQVVNRLRTDAGLPRVSAVVTQGRIAFVAPATIKLQPA